MHQQTTTALFKRSDTLFGVCEGMGQAFGFNANWLRIVLAVSMIWNAEVVLAAYAVMGFAVYAARAIVPPRRTKSVPAEARPSVRNGENDDSTMTAAAAA